MPNMFQRRQLLAAGLMPSLMSTASQAATPDAEAAALRAGGLVLAFRHAIAPGTFDPPQFKLGDCSTQRNLSEEGREQARRIGAWFKQRGLRPESVRTSPWCRCIETAQLAFGRAESWAPLGSPVIGTERSNAASLAALKQALAAAVQRPGRFEVWVTHMFVLSELLGADPRSGEGLLLGVAADGAPRLVGRLNL